MTRRDSRARRRGRLRTMAGVGLLVAYAGCGFNGVDVPELVGPAELATSVALTAVPDLIEADGFSTSLVTATVRDQNGPPAATSSSRSRTRAVAPPTSERCARPPPA